MTATDSNGNTFRVSVDDPRLSTGEIWSFRSGKVSVRDSAGNSFLVSVHDPRYLCGELIHTSVGIACSDETKRKIGNANSGKAHTEEHRRKNSEGNTGKVRSESAILKTAAKNRGRKNSEGGKRNMSMSHSKYLYDLVSPEGYTFKSILKRDLYLVHGLDPQTCVKFADLGQISFKNESACLQPSLNCIGWQVFKRLK